MPTEIRPDQISIVPTGAVVPSLIYANNTETTVSNTLTETTLNTIALPAGLLGPNDALMFEGMGKMLLNAAAFPSLKLKIGATVIVDTSPGANIGTNATTFGAFIDGSWNNNNSQTAQKAVLGINTTGGTNPSFYMLTGSSTFDTTTALTLTLTFKWSVASALLSYNHQFFSVWYYPASAL